MAENASPPVAPFDRFAATSPVNGGRKN